VVASQPPGNVRAQLRQLKVDVEQVESSDRLRIVDVYTGTLGHASKEKYSWPSLKAADLSIRWAKYLKDPKHQVSGLNWLRIADDHSVLARFNGEKVWTEVIISRHLPIGPIQQTTGIVGYVKGVHGESLYKELEAAYDGVIDVKVDEGGDEVRNLIRIRKMRNVKFDSHWHPLTIKDNLEVTLER